MSLGFGLNNTLGYSSLLTGAVSGIGNAAAIANASKVSDAGAVGGSNELSVSESVKPKSAADQFLEYMQMSDEEKLKYALLAQMGISKEQYDSMPPEEKAEIDKKIAERIEETAKAQAQSGAVAASSITAKLQMFANSANANDKKEPLLNFEV